MEELKTIIGLNGELYNFQLKGVEFFIRNNGRAILADECGVGKSVQALAYVAHEKLSKVLIICPASVKYAWESEIKKWIDSSSFVINSKTKLTEEIINSYNIFVINYDLLLKFFPLLSITKFDCLIGDESHYIKSPSTRRCKLVRKLSKNIPKILLLSGTPMLNRPVELFSSLNLIDPKTWNNWWEYSRRFCNGHQTHWGYYDCSGATNIAELREKISKYFLRRTKAQVLPELPPKTYINLPVELKNDYQVKYKFAEKNLIEYLRNIKNKTEAEINKSLQAEALVKLNELRQIASEGKIEYSQEIIENIIQGGEKVVVFSVYNKPLLQLKEYFKSKAVMIIGSTSEQERRENIKRFQNDRSCLIFLGGTHSAGIGITLTAASSVFFIDFDFVPANMQQSQDRIHRPGQTANKIFIYQLFAKDTIDEHSVKILDRKQKLFNQLIERKVMAEDGENIINKLIEVYKKNKMPQM